MQHIKYKCNKVVQPIYFLFVFCRESTHTVNVKWLRDVSAQLESLSTICSTMMDKCQHKRIQKVRESDSYNALISLMNLMSSGTQVIIAT